MPKDKNAQSGCASKGNAFSGKEMSGKERYEKLVELLESIRVDVGKFYTNKNSAAGTRCRKGLQEFRNMAQEIRLEIQNIKNSGK